MSRGKQNTLGLVMVRNGQIGLRARPPAINNDARIRSEGMGRDRSRPIRPPVMAPSAPIRNGDGGFSGK
jgi:hypothetical protein